MNFNKLLGAVVVSVLFGVGCGSDDSGEPIGGQAGASSDASVDSGGRGGAAGAGTAGRAGASGAIGTGTSGNGGVGGNSGTGVGGNSGTGGDQDASGDGSNTDVSVGGAGGGTSGGAGGTDGSLGTGGSIDASVASDGPAPEGSISCGVFNSSCVSGATCCSGVCDTQTNTCASNVTQCFAQGTPCSAPTDCCSLNCGANGFCAAAQCTSDGQACSNDAGRSACCSGACNGTTCQALNPSCRTAGNECGTSDQCCSHLCKDGHCALGGSYCVQTGDACVRGSDCCGGICNIAAGATLGTCAVPNPGATRCSGAVDGSFCNGCGQCCSRLCVPYALTGVFICQPANGCHIDGDLCVRDKDCCGNDNSLPTSGNNVQCVRENPGDPVGICRNPMGCSPEGNVCHYRQDSNYSCNVSSAPNNCCDAPGNSGACQLDQLGVPRCHAITVCRAAGETCAYTGDCCNGVPCVPDDTGQLRCLIVPDGGKICVPTSGNCTVTADCCPGNACSVAQGSTLGKCSPLQPPPFDGGSTPPSDGGTSVDGSTSVDGGTSTDGGTVPTDDSGATPDGGGSTSDGSSPPLDDAAPPPPPPVCSQYGQICAVNSDCCNAIPCTGGICRIPPM